MESEKEQPKNEYEVPESETQRISPTSLNDVNFTENPTDNSKKTGSEKTNDLARG